MASTAFISLSKGKELLSNLDPNLLMWVQSNTEIALGTVPLQAQYVIDLGTEEVRDSVPGAIADLPRRAVSGIRSRSRLLLHSGKYLFEIFDRTVECASLKDMLKKGLLAIGERSPGMLDQLTKVKGRTKRIVAKKPSDLFENPELVKEFADKLTDGWWYGTNNSAQETKRWLMRACEIAKMQWGKDFDTTI